jgi:osmotically-inducible protein OsmY
MFRPLLLVLTLPVLLSGCVAAAVGAGTEAGVALAEERSLGSNVDDKIIYSDVSKRYAEAGDELYAEVGVRVRHKRVMLTGTIPTQRQAEKAVAIAWQAKGVQEVINELIISEGSYRDAANDALVKKNLEARLFATKDVWVINYSIDVVQGTAYLLGRVYDRAELDRVMNVVRTTKGVKRVINHLQIRSEMSTDVSAPATGAPMESVPAYSTADQPISSGSQPSVDTSPPSSSSGTATTPAFQNTPYFDTTTPSNDPMTSPLSSSDLPPPAGGGY